MADEAATISVKAVAAGDEDVDDILAELDEFDKASACAAPACAAPRATSWRALGVLRRAFPQRSPALRQRVLLRGVAPDALVLRRRAGREEQGRAGAGRRKGQGRRRDAPPAGPPAGARCRSASVRYCGARARCPGGRVCAGSRPGVSASGDAGR